MISKIEIYAIALGVLMLAFGAAEFHGRNVGREEQRAESAKEVLAANTKADAATAKLQQVSEDKDSEWQTHVDALGKRVDDLQHGNGAIRMCRVADNGKLPPGSGSATQTGTTPGGSGHALQAGPDIRSALLVYGAECEGYREQVSLLQDFAAQQKKLIDAALSGR